MDIHSLQLLDGEVIYVAGKSTGEHSASASVNDWEIGVERMKLERLNYRMTMEGVPLLKARLQLGEMVSPCVHLGEQWVTLDSLKMDGGYVYVSLENAVDQNEQQEVLSDTVSTLPWIVKAGNIQLANSAFSMGNSQTRTVEWMLSGIGVEVDSLYNQGVIVKGHLKDLRAVEQDGLTLSTMQADFGLDSASTWIRGGFLRTQHSWLRLEAYADSNIEQILKQSLAVQLEGEIGLADLALFCADVPKDIQQKSISLQTIISLTEERLRVGQLILNMPDHFKLTGSGSLSDFPRAEPDGSL